MDTMKISSKFMRSLISKLVKNIIRKKFGYEVDIQLDELMVTIDEGKAHLRVNAGADISKDELTKIIKEIGLE